MDIAATLRTSRRRAGLTQAALAQRAGTSQATISAYEAARKHPSADTFTRLLAACGARLEVIEGAPVVRSVSSAELDRRGRILQQVLELAEALPSRRAGELRYPRLPGAPPAVA